MKKRFLSIVLAICLLLSCIPVTVFAADEPGDVYALLSEVLNKGGTQKLQRDYIVTRRTISLGKSVTIDLNGHVILFKGGHFEVGDSDSKNIKLTIKDDLAKNGTKPEHTGQFAGFPNGGVVTSTHGGTCGGCVRVTDTSIFNLEEGAMLYNSYASTEAPGSSNPGDGEGGAVYIDQGGTFNMKGGTIDGCTAATKGGAVFVEPEGIFDMSGGTIKNCKAQGIKKKELGGAVYIDDGGTFTMSNGTIQNCTAYYGAGGVFNDGTFTMSGGSIDNCSAENAGGVTNTGTFNMTNGTIKNCSATNGGAVVTGSTFTMKGGVIDNCKADNKGGGVTVMSSSITTGTFTLDGGTIKNCSAVFGGGVANGFDSLYNSYFTMKSGTIDNCRAKKVGGGVYNEDYTVSTMSGGTIKNCVAYCGGGVAVSRNASYTSSGKLILDNSASNELSKFNMSGGTIENCKAIDYNDDGKYSIGCGGGVFAFYSKVTMTGGTIKNCSASDSKGDAIWLFTNADMIADGGSVYGKCFVDDHYFDYTSEIKNTGSSKYTKFYDLVENQGNISGGVFYGGIKNTKNKNGVYGSVSNPYNIVTFDSDGGSSVSKQWFVNTSGATVLKPTDPTKENYQFMGWYNGNNKYDFTNTVSNSTKIFTLKAKWVKTGVETEAELRTALDEGITSIKLIGDFQLTSKLDLTNKVLTLDLNGHVLSAEMPLTDYIYLYASNSPGAQLTLEDSNPTATHKDSTLPLGGVLDCGIYLGVANGCPYTSTLRTGGGTVTEVVRLNHQNASIMPSSDNNTTTTSFKNSVIGSGGHIFDGIYYNTIKNGTYYNNLQQDLVSGKTVTFNDGDGIYAKEVVMKKAAVAPVDPEKDGYAFAGWYNGSTKYSFPQTITSSITLTAKWINEVTDETTLRSALNEGLTTIKQMADINLSSTLDLSKKDITIDLNGYVISGADISINAGNGKANLTLKDSRPTATHTDSTLPKGGVVKSKISMKKDGGSYNDCVLYANGGTVTSDFYTNTHIVSIKCTSNTPTAFTGNISGYVHLYGGIYYGSIASSVTIEAKKITFKNGNNTYAYEVVDTGNKTVTPINPPIKEGYNGFDGWYNGDTKYTFGSSLSEDITLTAKFNPITYGIVYFLNGGTVSPENPGNYTVESENITLNNPTKTGYTFIGWSGTDLSGNNNMTVTIPKGSTGLRMYGANFSQNTYTVKFDTNGGSSISDKTGVKWTDTVLSGITAPTKDGFEFTGWKCGDMTVNANTKYSDLAADDTVKSVTLVAQWKDTEKPVIIGLEKGKTYCDTVQFEVSDNVGIASVQVNYVELEPGTDGKYTLAAGFGMAIVDVTDKAGNKTSVVVTVNAGHTAGKDDGDCSTPVYCIYHPDTIVVEGKSHDFSGEWNKDKDGHWHICQNAGCTVADTKVSHSGTDDGDCTTAVVCECGYIITAANAQHSYGKWQSNGDGTHTRYCTVTGCNGYEDGKCTGGQATYFKKAVCKDCNTEYGNLLTDETAPTGEITVGTNKWNSFLNTITFGIFFKDTQSVTITASDDSYSHNGYTNDKAVKVEYYLYRGDTALTQADLAGKAFTAYNGKFSINPDNKYVVYARLTDFAGNVTYISSNGVVLDATAPVISGVENGKVYCEAQTVTVTEEYIESVKVNGAEVTLDANNQFTLNSAEGKQTIVVTDKAGNVSAEMIVTVNDGHTYEWQSENGQYWQKCKYCDDETAKKDIPTFTIDAPDTVCRTQDCEVSVTLPDSISDATLTNVFIGFGGAIDTTIENGMLSSTIESSSYPNNENSFKLIVYATTDDGFSFKVSKTVEIQNEHAGGVATCTELAICDTCGEPYGELDSTNHNLEKISAKPATVTEIGNTEYWHCLDCDKFFADANGEKEIELTDTVIAKLPPEIIEGKGQGITAGEKKELTFRSNAAFGDFIRAQLDGKTLDEKNYTVKEGSTVVTLKADYVATLSVGEHTIGIVSESGTAATTFTVNAKKIVNNDKKSPETGNDSETALWFALLLSCGGVIIVTGAYGKRKKRSR